jgi:hypothetical protein
MPWCRPLGRAFALAIARERGWVGPESKGADYPPSSTVSVTLGHVSICTGPNSPDRV